VAPSVLEEMSHPRIITARSPRRTLRHREDHMTLRVFPGASTSIAAGISNQPQHFYPNSSQHPQHRTQPAFANHQHLQGFANTPSDDMMDINIS
jgi:hypothetical protein